MNTRRAAIVIGLFVVLFGVRFVLDDPTYIGATFLLVLPTVLAALWFGVTGGVAVAVSAAVAFFVAERLDSSQDVALHTVVWATLVRLGGLVLVAVLVARLFTRQLELVRELDELEAVRDALRPAGRAAAGARARRALRAGAAGRGRGLLPDRRGAAGLDGAARRRRGGEGRGGGAAGGVRAPRRS